MTDAHARDTPLDGQSVSSVSSRADVIPSVFPSAAASCAVVSLVGIPRSDYSGSKHAGDDSKSEPLRKRRLHKILNEAKMWCLRTLKLTYRAMSELKMQSFLFEVMSRSFQKYQNCEVGVDGVLKRQGQVIDCLVQCELRNFNAFWDWRGRSAGGSPLSSNLISGATLLYWRHVADGALSSVFAQEFECLARHARRG